MTAGRFANIATVLALLLGIGEWVLLDWLSANGLPTWPVLAIGVLLCVFGSAYAYAKLLGFK